MLNSQNIHPIDIWKVCLFAAVSGAGVTCKSETDIKLVPSVVVDLDRLGATKTISATAATSESQTYLIKGNGYPIQVRSLTMQLAADYLVDDPDSGECQVENRLLVIDTKYPEYPMVAICGTLGFDRTSYSDQLNITYSMTVGSHFSVEVTAVTCAEDSFICSSDRGKCVRADQMCDGRQDCPQGEDEICSEQCGVSEKDYTGAKSNTFRNRIVGGEESIANAWPWQVLLNIMGDRKINHTCGGSIIGQQWILTAAHCCYKPTGGLLEPFKAKAIEVWVGLHDRRLVNRKRNIMTVEKVIANPLHVQRYNYMLPTMNHDTCLLMLTQPLNYSSKVKPVCLAQLPEPPPGTSCYISGWGNVQEADAGDKTDYTSPVLREAVVNIATVNQCINSDHYPGMTPEMLCAGRDAKDTCQGDSGGPLVCRVPGSNPVKWELAGVTSFGVGCARHPGIYMRTRRTLPWIADVLYNHSYAGWFTNTTVKQNDPSINKYTKKDFAVVVPKENGSSRIPDFEIQDAPVSGENLPAHLNVAEHAQKNRSDYPSAGPIARPELRLYTLQLIFIGLTVTCR